MKVLMKVSILAILGFFVSIQLSSCNRAIYDDLSLCPQGVHVSFYTKSPCQSEPIYPTDIKQTHLFAFDEKGVLLGGFEAKGIVLSPDFEQTIDHLYVGTSTFYAWGSEDLSRYDFSSFKVGETKKDEMILSLNHQAVDMATADMPSLYVGGPTNLHQEDRRALGTFYDDMAINMHQITNSLKVRIKGLKEDRDYEVCVVSPNAEYHIDGGIADGKDVTFHAPNNKYDGKTLTADFKLLKMEDNKSMKLVIFDRTRKRQVYSEDLIGRIIAQNPNINLSCDHVFELDLTVELGPEEIYVGVTASINQWNIVFRDLNL